MRVCLANCSTAHQPVQTCCQDELMAFVWAALQAAVRCPGHANNVQQKYLVDQPHVHARQASRASRDDHRT